MKMKDCHFGLYLLLSTGIALNPYPSHAYNGAVAVAVPVEGIVVDGDLSDWPEGMREYPIKLTEYAEKPVDEEDFQGTFRIGYNEQENALYVAVEVRDESVVVDKSAGSEWDSKDGCELYVDIKHRKEDASIIQYAIRGEDRSATLVPGESVWKKVRAEAQRSEDIHRYEWRIDLSEISEERIELYPQILLGVDIVVCDRDEDGSFSWMAWGSGTGKTASSDRVGLVVLSEETGMGTIKGRIEWEDMEEGVRLGKVRIQSLISDELCIEVKTDSQGVYEVELPVGEYRLGAGYRRRMSESKEVEVKEGHEKWVPTQFFANPPFGQTVPAGTGRTVPAGTGRTVPAGMGNTVQTRDGRWVNYDIVDGLADSWIVTICQDRDGQLWFGTDSGVSRYDGKSFTTFTTQDGLAGDSVSSMLRDRDGRLWFGTEDGVSRYDGKSFTTFTTQDGLANNKVSTIFQDRDGRFWFGTEDGVSRYDGKSFTTFTTQDGLASNKMLSICQDGDGQLWFGTFDGVSRYDGTSFTSQGGLVPYRAFSIFQDGDGQLWFGTVDGVTRYDGKDFTTFSTQDGLVGGNWVASIFQDGDGHLWFGMWGGVTRYDGTSFTSFTPQNGLAGTNVSTIFQDREGHLWFGTAGGVSRYDGTSFTTLTSQDGLVDNYVLSMLHDEDGQLWFGTQKGVSRYDGNRFITQDGLAGNDVWSIFQDGDGQLWFGTGGGLNRYDGTSFTTFTTQDGIAGNWVASIFQDGDGQLWFGTGGGLNRYDGTSFTTFTTQDGLADNEVYSIFQDGDGQLWFGTRKGLNRYDGKSFTTFTTQDGLAGNFVISISRDRDGQLWFGTDGGVSRYDGTSFTPFTMRDGLAGNSVLSILQDGDGQLWFGTDGGVSRYDGKTFQTLVRWDGLAYNVVTSIVQDQEGCLWFCTPGGVTRFRPPPSVPPPVFIDAVVADRRYEKPVELSLPSSAGLVVFEFHGISFKTRPEAMVYRYRLEGHEAEWHSTHVQRVEYEDLPLGDYLFEVEAVDRDLVYSERPATVRLTVHPPYGIIMLASGLGLALTGLVIASGLVIKRQQERNQAREQLVRDMEEELQTAHDMQMGLMPTEAPRIEGFDIIGRCLPANHVGGDFFQYFLQNGRLSVCVADVTGHAMEAAIPVVMFNGILESQMELGGSLEDLFTRLNRSLHRTRVDNRTFVCFTMGELDTSTRQLRLSNGGCPYPYHFRASTGEVAELQVDAYPLGVRAESSYPVIETHLEPGDRIVLCSDGIIEAENAEGEIFGFERTAETIRKGCQEGLSAAALLDRIIGEVKTLAGDTPQGDDQTAVILGVKA